MRQTDVRQHHCLMPPPIRAGGIINKQKYSETNCKPLPRQLTVISDKIGLLLMRYSTVPKISMSRPFAHIVALSRVSLLLC